MELKTVKMILAVAMLCSGFVHFTFANRLRIFNFTYSNTELIWEDLLKFCTDKNESLVTLYDQVDIDFIKSVILRERIDPGEGLYVGLHRSNQSVRWSDGNPYTYNMSTVHVTNGTLVCEGMETGQWKGFNCSDKKYFMCYRDDDYHLVKINKTWCQAQLYCRDNDTNLVTINNDTQNKKVIQEGKNESFWIGLMHDDWEWADKGCSTFRYDLEGTAEMNCTMIDTEAKWTKRECNQSDGETNIPTVCSKGERRIVIINESKTWEEAFDYCENNYSNLLQIEDNEDQTAVSQWLNYTKLNYTKSNNTTVFDYGQGDLFWIALRQSRVLGFWIWRDRTVSDNYWKDKQIPKMPFSNHCGAINRTDFTWRDENCWNRLPFLCEEKISFS